MLYRDTIGWLQWLALAIFLLLFDANSIDFIGFDSECIFCCLPGYTAEYIHKLLYQTTSSGEHCQHHIQ